MSRYIYTIIFTIGDNFSYARKCHFVEFENIIRNKSRITPMQQLYLWWIHAIYAPLCCRTVPTKWPWKILFEIDKSLQWRDSERDSVSNHQPRECLLSRLVRRRSKKTSKLRAIGLCAGNSSETGEFPAQRTSNAENVSIWWRHHVQTHNKHNKGRTVHSSWDEIILLQWSSWEWSRKPPHEGDRLKVFTYNSDRHLLFQMLTGD